MSKSLLLRFCSCYNISIIYGIDFFPFFVGRTTDRGALLKFIAAVAGKPVLTIGETEDFARIGGV